MMPYIGSYGYYEYGYCGKSFNLKHWRIAHFYKECNTDKNIIYRHMEKYRLKAGFNPCPRKFVVKIVSTDLVGTLKCFYSKCSQNPCRKNSPTKLVVDGFPQG